MPSIRTPHAARPLDTPVGPLLLVASHIGLRAVLWHHDNPARAGLGDTTLVERDTAVLDEAARQLDEYFAGSRTTFDLPLDLRGTPFQVAAWRALAEIPCGETRTYADQARLIGRPAAVRAVGAANGRNPISIVLPCHRVVGSNGSLTGFAGGLDAKRFLLEHERQHRSQRDQLEIGPSLVSSFQPSRRSAASAAAAQPGANQPLWA
jgi:methylated-DNA-[protein]-cysteine S-methyltransferase